MIEDPKPHSFCETPEEKCTMNYCDENGCQNRKRELVEPQEKQDKNKYSEEEIRKAFLASDEGWVNFDAWYENFKKTQH